MKGENCVKRDKMLRGVLLTLTGGIFWGLSGACGQFLLQAKGVPTGWLVSVRLLSAGAILLLLCLLRGEKQVFRIWKQDAAGILVFGVLGMSMCQYTYFSAITYSNAGTATVLEYLSPVLILVYLSVRSRRPPRGIEVLSILLAVGGTFLLATHGHPGEMVLSGRALFWGLLSAVAMSIYAVQPVPLLHKYGAALVTAWGMLLGGTALSCLFRPWRMPVTLDIGAVSALAVVVLIGSVAAFTLHLEGIRLVGPKKGSLFSSIEPVSATVFAVLWMKADFSPIDLIGFALILSTIFLLARDKQEE